MHCILSDVEIGDWHMQWCSVCAEHQAWLPTRASATQRGSHQMFRATWSAKRRGPVVVRFVSASGEWSSVRLALAAPYSVTPLKANAHVRKRAPCDKGVAAVSFSQEELTGGRLLAFNMLRGRGRRCHRGSHYHPLSSNAVRSCSSSASRRWRGIRSPRASRPSPPRLRLPRRSTPS